MAKWYRVFLLDKFVSCYYLFLLLLLFVSFTFCFFLHKVLHDYAEFTTCSITISLDQWRAAVYACLPRLQCVKMCHSISLIIMMLLASLKC